MSNRTAFVILVLVIAANLGLIGSYDALGMPRLQVDSVFFDNYATDSVTEYSCTGNAGAAGATWDCTSPPVANRVHHFKYVREGYVASVSCSFHNITNPTADGTITPWLFFDQKGVLGGTQAAPTFFHVCVDDYNTTAGGACSDINPETSGDPNGLCDNNCANPALEEGDHHFFTFKKVLLVEDDGLLTVGLRKQGTPTGAVFDASCAIVWSRGS